MSLNIKNPEAHALAQKLADQLGMSMTEAVTIALRDKLASAQREAEVARRKERILRMAKKMAAMIGPESLPDHAELLYDERGLPK